MTSVAIVDDNYAFVLELSAMVNSVPGFTVMGQFKNGIEIITYCKSQKQLPDIILMDIEMPRFDGIQTTDYLTTYFPDIKIAAVSSYIEKSLIEDILICGGFGYIFKTTAKQDKQLIAMPSFKPVLANALHSLAMGNEYIDERFANSWKISPRAELMQERLNEKGAQLQRYNLSKIEQELILLSGAEMSYTELGVLNNKSPRTIEGQINKTVKKLQSDKGKEGVFIFSLRNGLVKIAKFFKKDNN